MVESFSIFLLLFTFFALLGSVGARRSELSKGQREITFDRWFLPVFWSFHDHSAAFISYHVHT